MAIYSDINRLEELCVTPNELNESLMTARAIRQNYVSEIA